MECFAVPCPLIRCLRSIVLAAITCMPAGDISAAEFIPLGLPDEPSSRASVAAEVSRDGLVVAGMATIGPNEGRRQAFRWTRETGFVPLGTSGTQFLNMSADGSVVTWSGNSGSRDGSSIWSEELGLIELNQGVGAISRSTTIADDGSITVGNNHGFAPQGPYGPVKWTPQGGVESLDIPSDVFCCDPRISPDGTVISGNLQAPPVIGGIFGFLGPIWRWTEDDGLATLDELPGQNWYSTTGISYDGSVIAGVSAAVPEDASRQSILDAPKTLWRWTEETGIVALAEGTTEFNFQDNINQNRGSSWKFLSADGTVLAGDVRSNDGQVADVYRWTETTGLEILPTLPGTTHSGLKDMSPDGKWLFGQSWSLPYRGNEELVPWLWSEHTGLLNLFDVFEAQGLGQAIEGWEGLWWDHAGRISADARAVIGTGRNPDGFFEGWIAYLDPLVSPVSLPGDYNNNGQVEQADLDLVLLHWGSDVVPETWLADLPTGAIDQEELDKVLLGWGDTSAAMSKTAAVPEPTTAAMVFIVLLILFSTCHKCNFWSPHFTLATRQRVHLFSCMLLFTWLATSKTQADVVLPQEAMVSGTGFPVDFGPETFTFDGIPETIAEGVLSVTERVYRVAPDRQWLEYYFETTDGRPIWDPSGRFEWLIEQLDFQVPVHTTGLPENSIVHLTIDGVAQEGAPTARWDVGTHPYDETIQHVLHLKGAIVRPSSAVQQSTFFGPPESFFEGTGIDLSQVNGFGNTVLFIDGASDPSFLLGDFNDNGRVEQADLDLVLLNWGNPGYLMPTGWTNDLPIGTIDQEELDKVLLAWGATGAAATTTATVPEPATTVLLLAALLGMTAIHRRTFRTRCQSTTG